MPYSEINGLRYYYEISGRGEPLLLLHGFTGSSESWSFHVDFFSREFQVITMDLPGHGRTESPPEPGRYAMEVCSRDVIALLQEIVSGPVNLLGYSMGGRLALHVALTYPAMIQRLILESASPGLQTAAERRERRESDRRLATFIEQEGIEAFVNRWQQLPLFASQAALSPSVRDRLRRQRLSNQPAGLANSLRGMGTGAQPSLWSRLLQLRPPLLLLVGQRDRKFLAIGRLIQALAPDARLIVAPDAGHNVHLERPDLFDEIILDYLNHGEGNASPVGDLK